MQADLSICCLDLSYDFFSRDANHILSQLMSQKLLVCENTFLSWYGLKSGMEMKRNGID